MPLAFIIDAFIGQSKRRAEGKQTMSNATVHTSNPFVHRSFYSLELAIATQSSTKQPT
jgi:hypothetical protein